MNKWLLEVEWEHPEWLLLGIPIVVIWVCLSLTAWFRNNAARKLFAAPEMFPNSGQKQRSIFSLLPLGLQLIGIIGIVTALAAPKFGELEQSVASSGHDIYVLLDVSRSMLAEDVSPSRLERAKADIASLTSRLKGERIGLIVFAGQPVIRCPLTVDYENFRKAVANVDLVSSPRGGTAIGKAIRKALEMFTQTENSKHTLLLITDGDDQNSDPLGAARLAEESQVPINIIGLGDTSIGARVPTAPSGRSFVEYEGEQVWSKLDSELLTKMANMTGGNYVGVGTKSLNLDSLYQQCLERTDVGNSTHTESITTKAEQFQWPLGIGLLAIFLGLMTGLWRNSSHRAKLTRGVAGSFLLLGSCESTCLVIAGQVDALNTSAIEHFNAGDLVKASEELKLAKSLLSKSEIPVRAVIDFNLGCISQANGDFEAAVTQYELASRSLDLSVIAAAQYQLGNVFLAKLVSKGTTQANTSVTEAPTDTEQTGPGRTDEELALRAIEAYENALSINPSHRSSKVHLESIKLWLASEKKASKDATLQKEISSLSFLDYLERLIEKQEAIASEAAQIPTYRKISEQHALRIRQREIIDELPQLTSKLQAEISNAQSPNRETQSSQNANAAAIEQISDKLSLVSQTMEQCVKELASFRSVAATQVALTATQELEDLWNSIANYEQLLAKAYQAESELVDSASRFKISKPDIPQGEDGNPPSLSSTPWAQSQFRNIKRTSALETKAKLMADAIRENTKQHDNHPELSDAPSPQNSQQAPNEEQAKTLTATLAALDKAVELAPKAVSTMEKAIDAAEGSEFTSAHQLAIDAQSILEDLLKSLPPPPPESSDDQQQEPQDSESSQEQKQSEDSKSKDSEDSKSEASQSQDNPSQESQSQPDSANEQKNDSKEGSTEGQMDKSSEEKKQEQSSPPEGKQDEKESDDPLNQESDLSKEKDAQAEKDESQNAPKDAKNEGADKPQEQATKGSESNETSSISSNQSQESGQQALVSQERMDEIMRKVKEREAAKRIRDRKFQELLRSRQRVEKDW